MAEGKIVERGPHKQLILQAEGKYLNMLSFDQSKSKADETEEEGKEYDDGGEHDMGNGRKNSASRQGSVVSTRSNSTNKNGTPRRSISADGGAAAADEEAGKFTNDEEDPEEAGWGVLLRYFQVMYTRPNISHEMYPVQKYGFTFCGPRNREMLVREPFRLMGDDSIV